MKRWPLRPRRREPETRPAKPNAYDLWLMVDGDRAKYRQLLLDHGLIRPLAPGEVPEPLPCGWPGPANRTGGLGDYEDEEAPG